MKYTLMRFIKKLKRKLIRLVKHNYIVETIKNKKKRVNDQKKLETIRLKYPENYKLFLEIVPGDIVYCKMPYSDEELKKVPEGHKERPYVIIGKNELYLYGFQCTTHIRSNIPYQERFCCGRFTYYDKKERKYMESESNAVIQRIYSIPISNIRYIYSTLEIWEEEEILRRLYARSNRLHIKMTEKCQLNHDKVQIKIGDIIRVQNDLMFIYDITEDGYIGYKAFFEKPKNINVRYIPRKFGPCYYDVRFPILLTQRSINNLVYISSSSEKSLVLKEISTFKRTQKHLKKVAKRENKNNISNDFFVTCNMIN